MGELVGLFVEVLVGETLVLISQGNGIRSLFNLPFKALMNQALGDINLGLVPSFR